MRLLTLENKVHPLFDEMAGLLLKYLGPIRGDLKQAPSAKYWGEVQTVRSVIVAFAAKMFILELQDKETDRNELIKVFEECFLSNLDLSLDQAEKARDERLGKKR